MDHGQNVKVSDVRAYGKARIRNPEPEPERETETEPEPELEPELKWGSTETSSQYPCGNKI